MVDPCPTFYSPLTSILDTAFRHKEDINWLFQLFHEVILPIIAGYFGGFIAWRWGSANRVRVFAGIGLFIISFVAFGYWAIPRESFYITKTGPEVAAAADDKVLLSGTRYYDPGCPYVVVTTKGDSGSARDKELIHDIVLIQNNGLWNANAYIKAYNSGTQVTIQIALSNFPRGCFRAATETEQREGNTGKFVEDNPEGRTCLYHPLSPTIRRR